jgi:hypothetical protein
MLRRGVIIEWGPERYYLDEDNLREYRKSRRMIAISILIFLLLFLLIDLLVLKY